jgi:hypothetical protein
MTSQPHHETLPEEWEPVTFAVLCPDAPPGEYGSREDPSPYISLEDPEPDLALLLHADDRVINQGMVRVLYRYPLGTAGPSAEEQARGGWIFEAAAPEGFFTRAALARAIAARYQAIYAEEEGNAPPAGDLPGMLNRATTDGQYGIWGHRLGDLLLHTVGHSAEADLYTLGIDS